MTMSMVNVAHVNQDRSAQRARDRHRTAIIAATDTPYRDRKHLSHSLCPVTKPDALLSVHELFTKTRRLEIRTEQQCWLTTSHGPHDAAVSHRSPFRA
jgi:hypothetical protein